MEKLTTFLVSFGVIFTFYLFFVILNKKKSNEIFNTYEALMLKARYKLTFKNISKKKFAFIIAITNSFICAFTYTVMDFFENIYLKFIMAGLILIILILIFYMFIGLYLRKKENSNV